MSPAIGADETMPEVERWKLEAETHKARANEAERQLTNALRRISFYEDQIIQRAEAAAQTEETP